MPSMGPRYPKQLNKIALGEQYSVVKIAALCEVSERSVLRWAQQGYLEKNTSNNYQLNPKTTPDRETATVITVQRKYSNEELEDFYKQIAAGHRPMAIDVGRFVREKAETKTFEAILEALSEFREFVQFVIEFH